MQQQLILLTIDATFEKPAIGNTVRLHHERVISGFTAANQDKNILIAEFFAMP